MVKKKNLIAASWNVGRWCRRQIFLDSFEGGRPQVSPPSSGRRPPRLSSQARRLDSFNPAEEIRAPPKKRSIGGFPMKMISLTSFAEPPPKRVRSDAVSPAAAASEALALKTAPAAQASTASSLSKGKDVPAAITAPPSVISSLEAFASQFTSLEADKIRLQEEAKSSSSKLDGAIKKAAIACQEVDSLKEELNKLKERLKEEEARAAEKDELLRQSALALLEDASIHATALDKIPSNSANGVSMVLATHQLTRELLDKGKGALARMHSMIFPKAKQEKTLGQLIDAFAVDTKEVIEAPDDRPAPTPGRATYGVAAFDLLTLPFAYIAHWRKPLLRKHVYAKPSRAAAIARSGDRVCSQDAAGREVPPKASPSTPLPSPPPSSSPALPMKRE
ncbi:hypothetical protein QYE76_064476 [Lolium multiflorum]|uniref:Uncharacterized protein n=1 Tax=Lolium multiflorum TaxID=4521 RepID=A0AAD8S6I6_LOLMU|nr:hypothetical protein QYE76_064476 [Lolium multiflorum]